MQWPVYYHPEAEAELAALPATERAAIGHAVEKLQSQGPALGHPHSSAIKISIHLRELRPRSGRSRWRVFYQQLGTAFVIGAIGPEANVSQHRFKRAVSAAERRIDEVKDDN